jgi:hypothetical protein
MVEAALVELHGIAPDGVPALRSRFGTFQRGGLLGKQPGRGARLQYGPDELHRVVLAFELTQMGMSPTTVLWLVRKFWDKRLRDICLNAERALVRETSHVVLLLSGLTAMDGPEQSVPNINHMTMDRLAATLSLAIRGQDELRDPPARALVVNLSAQLSRFHNALANYHLSPAMLAGLEDAPKSKRAPRPRRRTKTRSR